MSFNLISAFDTGSLKSRKNECIKSVEGGTCFVILLLVLADDFILLFFFLLLLLLLMSNFLFFLVFILSWIVSLASKLFDEDVLFFSNLYLFKSKSSSSGKICVLY